MRKTVRSALSAALLAGLLVLTTTQSASAAIFSWMDNVSINPNGTVYYDTRASLSTSFSRTGVAAKINNANGQLWVTQVWFGTYSTSSADSVSISGPRSFLPTKASFKFAPGTTSSDKVKVSAWLLDAKMAGMGRSSNPDPEGSISADPEVPSQQAVSLNDLMEDEVPGIAIAREGAIDGTIFWSGSTDDGQTCLFTSRGEYVAQACTSDKNFEKRGLSQYTQGDGFSAQVVLVPGERMEVSAASASGLEKVSDSLAANIGSPVEDEVMLLQDAQQGTLPIEVQIASPIE